MIYDLTPPASESLAVWPGDTPLSRDVLLDIGKGDTITLSMIRATVHLGAHADAPSHYGAGARTIDQQPIEPYLGRCQVVTAAATRGERFGEPDLAAPITEPRVLIRTETFPDPTRFNKDFAALAPELMDSLAAGGAILVGVDTPSVDLFDSKDLPTHRSALKNNVALLEGLTFTNVADGVYELIALPLKLVGFDASPVRAILRTI